MGRKVQPRESYLGEVQAIARLRESARIDLSLSETQLQEIDEKSTALIECLMRVETERTTNNVTTGKEKAG